MNRLADLLMGVFRLITVYSAVFSIACGGGGGGGGYSPPPPTAPTIQTQPASQAVTLGQLASFTVVASGTSPLNYQWRKGGTNLATGTSATFTIPSTQSSDGGTYDVVVSNTAGNVTSQTVTLTVLQPTGVPINLQGINFSPAVYYTPGQPYADAMRAAADFFDVATASIAVPVDANGWPTTDARLLLWSNTGFMSGTYRIIVGGRATLTGLGAFILDPAGVQYDAARDTTTAVATVASDAEAAAELQMTDTRRTPASAAGSGVRFVKVMRPVTRGSATSHDAAEIFHRDFITLMKKFGSSGN